MRPAGHLHGLLTDRCLHPAVRRFVDLHDDNWHNHHDSDPLCWIDECLASYSYPASSGDDVPPTKFVQLKDTPRPATRRY